MISDAKDPNKVKAGKAAALARWGPTPRVVRLDSLSHEQIVLVMALIDAAKSQRAASTEAA